MGVQYFPVLQGYEKLYFCESQSACGDWKSLPQRIAELDTFADKLGILQLSSFISVDRDESIFDDDMVDDMERDGELINGSWYYQEQYLWSVELQWFPPDQGLITVRSLVSHLYMIQDKEAIDEDDEEPYESVIIELQAMEKILNRAIQEKKLFRISISV
jgi:hypothetical protein